jgi:hypothetical protein
MPDPQPGVITWQPSQIRESVKLEVEKYLATLPRDRGAMAEISIDMQRGVNLAVAVRDPKNGNWEAGLYVGKSFDGPIVGGVYGKILF